MNCPNCGAVIPEGTNYCTSCYFQVDQNNNAQPTYNTTFKLSTNEYNQPDQIYQTTDQNTYQNAFQDPYLSSGPNNQYQQNYQQQMHAGTGIGTAPAKNISSAAKIIAVLLLLAIAATIIVFIFTGNNYNGKYKCIEMTYQGITYDEDFIKTYGEETVMTVTDNRCEIEGDYCYISIKGSEVEIKDSDDTYHGTYDKKEKTITFEADDITFVFKKQ